MLLSRFAENAFWLGRYMERVESLARLLWVTEAFAADQESDEAWAPILSVFADETSFAECGKAATAMNVARFYLIDGNNPNSAMSAAFGTSTPIRTKIYRRDRTATRAAGTLQAAAARRRYAFSGFRVRTVCSAEPRAAIRTSRRALTPAVNSLRQSS